MYGILLDSERQAAILAMAVHYAGSVMNTGEKSKVTVMIGAALSSMAANFPEDAEIIDQKSRDLIEEIHGQSEVSMQLLIEKWNLQTILLPKDLIDRLEEEVEDQEGDEWKN